MDFSKLEYFIGFCTCGSVTKAAESMHITAQGLSKAISSIEEECGVPLVNRGVGGLSLTPAGEYFLQRAKLLTQAYQETLDRLMEISCIPRGHLKVGLAHGVIPALGVKLFSDFQALYPEITVELTELEDLILEQQVQDGSLQLGFTIGSPGNGKFEDNFLHSRSQVILCSVNNPISTRKSVTFSDLRGQKAILLKDSFKKNSVIKDRLTRAGVDILPITGISEMNTILSLCKENAGIGICADGVLSLVDEGSVVSVPFDEPDFFWDIHLITLNRDTLSYPAKLLRDSILRAFRQDSSGL